ncbi:MFS transporter [Sneathiella limimaris]|uniref:MFS transporter n=1 Tax=Sneathiella limimaris TaxID=1964213 RepID=UPI00146D3D7C|nr:MFS transporter [Sneathiella limimaris]
MAMPLIPAFVLLPVFYAESVGIGLAATGTVLLLVRITDVISDPIIGWVSEKLRMFTWGRRLQIIVGALLAGVSIHFLFNPEATSGPIHLFVWCALMLFGWSAVQIPYLAWVVDLSPDYNRRTQLNSGRELSGLIGILILAGLLFLWAEMDAFEQMSNSSTLILIAGLLVFPALLFLKDQPIRSSGNFEWSRLKGLFENRLYWRLSFAWFLSGLSIGVATACFPLFVEHVLGGTTEIRAKLLGLYFVCGVIGIPVCVWLSKRFSKHRAWGVMMGIASIVFLLVPFLGEGDYLVFAFACVVTGIALGSDLALPPSLQSDVVDWDYYKNRIPRSTLLYALWSMITKLSLGIGIGTAFWIIDAGEGTNSQIDPTLVALIYGLVPAVLKLGAVGLVWNFPLSPQRHAALRRRLAYRNKN